MRVKVVLGLAVVFVAAVSVSEAQFMDAIRGFFRPRRQQRPQNFQQQQPNPNQFQQQQGQPGPGQFQQQGQPSQFRGQPPPRQQPQFGQPPRNQFRGQPQQPQQQQRPRFPPPRFQPQGQPQPQFPRGPPRQQPQQFQTQPQFPQPQRPIDNNVILLNDPEEELLRSAAGRPGTSQNSNAASSSSNNGNGNKGSGSSSTPTCRALTPDDQFDRESPRCPPAEPNHFWNGKRYILTFLLGEECKKFTGIQADNYCKEQGGRAVSLDSNEASEHFLGVAAQHAQRYYWTGGRMNHACGVLSWPSGSQEGWVKGQRYWSHTGGGKDKGPQPDNRNHDQDGQEPELCLGVLNNFYADGIKWHDVACHHKKPTICELP